MRLGTHSSTRHAPRPPCARASAYRSQPRLRPLPRRPLSLELLPAPVTPGRPGPRPARSRTLSATAAPWVPVGRRAPGCAAAASGGATASRARAGGWGVDEKGAEGGTRRALRLGWREEETATSAEPGEARMGKGKLGPLPWPNPDLRPSLRSPPLLPGSPPGAALGLPHHRPDSRHPCPARPLWL